jgi:hypothetical protein
LTNARRYGTEIFKKALEGLVREGEVLTDKVRYWLPQGAEKESPSESDA